MAFLVYERLTQQGVTILNATPGGFQLAGYRLIYQAWDKRGKPTNQGWHVALDELVRLHTQGQHTSDTRRLVIDFDPKAQRRIGLIELLDVYAYTYQGAAPGQAYWTPLMLRMRDVFYQEYAHDMTHGQKQQIIGTIPHPDQAPEFLEFLYLHGDGGGWRWGRIGATNAVFLKSEVRDYFRQFF